MKFKKIAGLLAGVLLVSSVKLAHAVNFAGVDLHVTVNASYDIAVIGSTWTTFNPVNLGDANGVASLSAVVVQNLPTSVLSVTYRLAANDDSDWSVGVATTNFTYSPGADECVVRAIFNTVAVATATFNANPGNFNLVSHTWNNDPYGHGVHQDSSAGTSMTTPPSLNDPQGFRQANGTLFKGDQTGVGIAPNTNQNLWFQFIPATQASVKKDWQTRYLAVSIVADPS